MITCLLMYLSMMLAKTSSISQKTRLGRKYKLSGFLATTKQFELSNASGVYFTALWAIAEYFFRRRVNFQDLQVWSLLPWTLQICEVHLPNFLWLRQIEMKTSRGFSWSNLRRWNYNLRLLYMYATLLKLNRVGTPKQWQSSDKKMGLK